MITRRDFLAASAYAIAAPLFPTTRAAVTLRIPEKGTGPVMPDDFIGLSYEVEQLADPGFFSPHNTGLVRQFRALTPRGILRTGGNTGEFGWWKATTGSPEPVHPPTREVVGEPKAEFYPVTPEAVRNLAAFLDATRWRCIYGLNLGTNTPPRAADEAAFVAKALGSRLLYFQIGNEPELFSMHLRDPKSWSPHVYLQEWLLLARAVAARVPAATFGIPDLGGNHSWMTAIADEWASIAGRPPIAEFTHHYYFDGPATNPAVTIPNLLKPATLAGVQRTADVARSAAAKMGVPVRMSEGNTCYGGGKPGLSDVFAAALWAADYSLLLARNGYTGVNLHGGTGRVVANGLGGSLPGDALLANEGATPAEVARHPHPFYSPIGAFGSEYVLEPVAYGLQFAGALRGGRFFDADFTSTLQASGVNATAYGAELRGGHRSVIVVNKDLGNDLDVEFDFGTAAKGPVEVVTLRAPAIDSREAQIVRAPGHLRLESGRITLHIPRSSAIAVRTK
ncbi:MAG: hypothetical protein ACREL5_08075 [Gemmatimonadales bacterium]